MASISVCLKVGRQHDLDALLLVRGVRLHDTLELLVDRLEERRDLAHSQLGALPRFGERPNAPLGAVDEARLDQVEAGPAHLVFDPRLPGDGRRLELVVVDGDAVDDHVGHLARTT